LTGFFARSSKADWARLSPRGRETARWVAVLVSLGFTHAEVAAKLEQVRETIRQRAPHLPLPTGPIREGWVSARMRDLRKELEEA
jgi:TRAP-type C4-dicarboxylate transport system permease small subunit